MKPMQSNSSLTTFRRCPREYSYAYVMRRRPKVKSAALQFGSLMHLALNAWWSAKIACDLASSVLCLTSSLLELSKHTDCDPFEMAKAECLMHGYTVAWSSQPYVRVAVEQKFRLPIVYDGSAARYELGGSIDAVVMEEKTGLVHLMEHKTTSQDISIGSDYWRHVVSLDSQVSTYMAAARDLGFYPKNTIYDVIRKPGMSPLKATPSESRKYTIPTAKNPIPKLYANQRERDETPEEYRARLFDEISSNPSKYFQRMEIVRLPLDNESHEKDTWQTARMIQFCEDNDLYPRGTTSCERYGRLCDYHDVCSGTASINDSRFEKKESTHHEY